jgi:hypothetical protein
MPKRPAIRNDKKQLKHHFLTNANQSNIYKTLTQSIQDNGKSYKELMNDITTFFDVDGVLTR